MIWEIFSRWVRQQRPQTSSNRHVQQAVRFEIAIEELLAPPIPSVSTIARLLRVAGAVDTNPKKRPKSSYVRFERDQAMALWQTDAFEYKLFDEHTSKVTIYQILDDATRCV